MKSTSHKNKRMFTLFTGKTDSAFLPVREKRIELRMRNVSINDRNNSYLT